MTKRLVDQHTFVLWRYEDNSIDLQCVREGDDTFEELAYLEACVVARTLGEQIKESEEVFSLRAYESGSAATAWRGEAGCMDGWKQFRWYKSITHQATYGSLVSWPDPPQFLMEALWALEYASARLAAWWGRSKSAQKSPLVEDELKIGPDELEPLPPNVVRLPVRSKG